MQKLVAGLLAAAFLGAACAGEDRPSEAEWAAQWEQAKQLIPDSAELAAGGRELCDELDGELRVALPELLPTPAEVLDGPVEEWNAHALRIMFECPDDETTMAEQLDQLEVLTAAVDAGLDETTN